MLDSLRYLLVANRSEIILMIAAAVAGIGFRTSALNAGFSNLAWVDALLVGACALLPGILPSSHGKPQPGAVPLSQEAHRSANPLP